MCEDCGLLEDVAALTGTEAHHAVDVPGAVGILAIQGAARVSLREVAHTNTSFRLVCVCGGGGDSEDSSLIFFPRALRSDKEPFKIVSQ